MKDLVQGVPLSLTVIFALSSIGCIRYSEAPVIPVVKSGSTGVTVVADVGFVTPESALHDADADTYLISNIGGSPFGTDKKGFISRVRTDGSIENLKWIDGSQDSIELDAPKGMGISGETLYVADVTKVRKFDRKTGKPQGSVAIDGVSFLNDIAVGKDGTVYVTDTGLGEGFSATKTDAVYAISPDAKVRELVKAEDLGQPNGLLVDGDDLLMITWEKGALERIAPDGKKTLIAKLPEAQLDGVVKGSSGNYLVSSWAGSCVYSVTTGGDVSVAVEELKAPADLGYDAKRGMLLIPWFEDNKLTMLAAD